MFSITAWPSTDLVKPTVSMRYIMNTWAVTLRFGRDELTIHCSPAQLRELCTEWQKASRKASESKNFNSQEEETSG